MTLRRGTRNVHIRCPSEGGTDTDLVAGTPQGHEIVETLTVTRRSDPDHCDESRSRRPAERLGTALTETEAVR